jgi:hypothetical protein
MFEAKVWLTAAADVKQADHQQLKVQDRCRALNVSHRSRARQNKDSSSKIASENPLLGRGFGLRMHS